VSLLEHSGPIRYGARHRAKTRAADARSVEKARQYGLRQLMGESGASQHATERFLRGERVHPATRAKLERAVQELERALARTTNRPPRSSTTAE
jgi:hypothetical protein